MAPCFFLPWPSLVFLGKNSASKSQGSFLTQSLRMLYKAYMVILYLASQGKQGICSNQPSEGFIHIDNIKDQYLKGANYHYAGSFSYLFTATLVTFLRSSLSTPKTQGPPKEIGGCFLIPIGAEAERPEVSSAAFLEGKFVVPFWD